MRVSVQPWLFEGNPAFHRLQLVFVANNSLSIRSIRQDGPTQGILAKIVHKTIPGYCRELVTDVKGSLGPEGGGVQGGWGIIAGDWQSVSSDVLFWFVFAFSFKIRMNSDVIKSYESYIVRNKPYKNTYNRPPPQKKKHSRPVCWKHLKKTFPTSISETLFLKKTHTPEIGISET